MECPMDTYISGSKRHREAISLFLRPASPYPSASPRIQDTVPPDVLAPALLPFREAPYPASSLRRIISWGEAVPVTPMELVSRLTEHSDTPEPLTPPFPLWRCRPRSSYPSPNIVPFPFLRFYFINFCRTRTSSSTTSSFPSRCFPATQVRIWLARRTLLSC